ncbi:hypothetical protein GT370_12995 [Acidocella sp. MX-AZ03]|uniref:ABC transporter permease n=1 Tax=Acidocella sp. MX-AZ03 TaxID=2697363 RepID=UPI0022DD5384|nr:hypothetical protein [Acidocella sp. MX-AZ03]WBO58157.1 hypothetical protein GT370_12995 [Acidocella sp. MX-AZ03]
MLFRLEPRGERSGFWSIGSPVLAILLTIVTMMVIFALLGKPPVQGIETFLITPIANVSGLSSLAVRAAPLIMIGAGLALCYRANVWNIGGDGQFTMGALAGAGVALALPNGAFWWEYPLVLALGVLGGMVWAGLVAWLKLKFNANEILTSLMLVYVANLILVWLVTGPWRDPQGFGFPQSAMFGAGRRLRILAAPPSISAARWRRCWRWCCGRFWGARCWGFSCGWWGRHRGRRALPGFPMQG